MAIGRPAQTLRADINIAPFIDVLLVLLVVFMLSVNVRTVLPTQLAQEGRGVRKSESIVLELTNDGEYLLNTVRIPPESLASTLRAVFALRQDGALFVKSGGQRTYAETIEAVDVARGAGVKLVALVP